MTGSIIGSIDVAQAMLVVFIGFILALFVYLHREDKREGYPLIDPAGGRDLVGWPLPPPPKHYLTLQGEIVTMPHPEGRVDLAMRPLHPWPGAPFVPTGDPMQDGLGAASWAMKEDKPLMTWEGVPQLRPLRILPEWTVDPTDPDPRGWPVRDADGVQVGTVTDLWLDHGPKILRYLEVALSLPGPATRAMIPIYFAEIYPRSPEVCVPALFARHFAAFPQLQAADTITAREEDRVVQLLRRRRPLRQRHPTGAIPMSATLFEPAFLERPAVVDRMSSDQVRGIPGPLPPGETIVWQGKPAFRSLARHLCRVDGVALYFTIVLVGTAAIAALHGSTAAQLGLTMAPLLAAAAGALAFLLGMAWLIARTTEYTLTTRRLVIRSGVALPAILVIPYNAIASAAVTLHKDQTGDLPLAMKPGHPRCPAPHLAAQPPMEIHRTPAHAPQRPAGRPRRIHPGQRTGKGPGGGPYGAI